MALRTSLIVDYASNITGMARRDARALKGFSKSGKASLRGIGKTMQGLGNQLDRVANKWTGLAGGAAAGIASSQFLELETRLTDLGVQAGIGDEAVAKLKDRLFEISKNPEIKVDPSQLLDAIDAIVGDSGNLDFAISQMENMATAMRGASAQGAEVGKVFSQMQLKFGIEGDDQAAAAIALLIEQGKAGSFQFKDLAAEAESMFATYAATTQRVGQQAIREVGALAQIIRPAVGSAAEAKTVFQALFRELGKKEVQELLQANGIQIFDPEDPTRMRSAVDLLKEITQAADGSRIKISQAFKDSESMKAFSTILIDFHDQTTASFESLDKMMAVNASVAQLKADSARKANDGLATLVQLKTTLQQVSDEALSGPIKDVVDAINSLDPATQERVAEALVYGAGGLAAMAVSVKAIKAVGSVSHGVSSMFGNKSQPLGPGAQPGTQPGAQTVGVTPVRVTNWPPRLLSGEGGGKKGRRGKKGQGRNGRNGNSNSNLVAATNGATAAATTAQAGAVARAGNFAGKALRGVPALGTGIAVYAAGDILLDGSRTTGEKVEAGAGLAGGLIASAVGAKVGALTGLAGGPFAPATVPIGTAAGAVGGYFLGEAGVNALMEKAKAWWADEDRQTAAPPNFDASLKIQVDATGATRVVEADPGGIKLEIEEYLRGGSGAVVQ